MVWNKILAMIACAHGVAHLVLDVSTLVNLNIWESQSHSSSAARMPSSHASHQ
eukprot:gnl/Chilomastix_caulleri/2902.p3 GENE.gnl/Chilomastix_caulleri/2902~~gnl/Chilomastix_caulleri/2902.p3  ORF type:complete len:53 (-),score=7.33 gnl/Chilomastix_caulleri/2902:116-274(-)